jgi:hypothetical protein
MFTGMEKEYFEQMLEAKLQNLHDKADMIIELQKKTNGRVTHLEDDMEEMKIYRAKEETSWKIWGRIATVVGGIIGGVLGYFANKFL